jgi:hypothetical protein
VSVYYAREPGEQGQVITDEGAAAGLLLTELLERGVMPVRAALELVSYLADILSIAEEDGAVHGDIRPGSVRLDEGGTVVIEGYGQPRRSTRAPEGFPLGVATDTYALALILVSSLSNVPFGAIPRDRDAHDDLMVDRLRGVDWGDLAGKRWLDDVLLFLSSMLAYDPTERPAPLDVANVLGQIAAAAPGDDLTAWAEQAFSDRGRKRGRSAFSPMPEEDLGGPVSIGGAQVSRTAALRIRQAASAKGESTNFWTRDKIASMLGDEEDVSAPLRKEFKVAPPPASGRKKPPEATTAPPVPDSTFSGGATAPPAPTPIGRMSPPKPAPPAPPTPVARPASPPPISGPIAVSGPIASAGAPPAEAPSPAPSSNRATLAIGLVLVLVVLCGGGGLLAGLVYYLRGQDAAEPVAVEVDVEEEAAPAEAGGAEPAAEPTEPAEAAPAEGAEAAAADKKSADAPAEKPADKAPPPREKKETARSSTSTSTSSSPSKSSGGTTASSSSTTSTASTTRAAPPPPSGSFPADVKFSLMGKEARVECGDGQRRDFVGTVRLTFDSITTCIIKAGGGKTAVTVRGSGSFTCTEDAGVVACGGG